MPTIAFSGAVQRSDTSTIVDLMQLGPSLEVANDSSDTVSIGAAGSYTVPFGGNITSAKVVMIFSDLQLSIVLTTTAGVHPVAKGTHLMLFNTDVTSIVLTNLDSSKATNVRIFLGA